LGSILLPLLSFSVQAADRVYLKPSEFLKGHFRGTIPPTRSLSLQADQQNRIKRLLGRAYTPGRVRYWTDGKKTVWILEEIGKTKPITTGYAVRGGKIEDVKVLIYRESHGWEVSSPSFTNQFKNATLGSSGRLSRKINGISGATLSVNALTKLGRVALYLNTLK